MNIQQNSWGLSFGLVPVPDHLHKVTEEPIFEPHSSVYKEKARDMYATIRSALSEKMLNGYKHGKNKFFYEEMKKTDMLKYPNGKIMSFPSFEKHLAAVRLSLGMPKREEVGHKIHSLFDNGMSEKDITIYLDVNPTTVYYSLLRSGRISARPRARGVSKDQILKFGKNKKEALKNMHAQGYSVEEICKTLNTTKYYISDCVRGKA